MVSLLFPKCSCCNRGSSSLVSRLSDITFPVRHRGMFRQLCTTCVLKMNPGQFCPVCFQVYDAENPVLEPGDQKMCASCPSICHSLCVIPGSNTFKCPVCENCNFSFFATKESDVNKSRQFLAAAKLAKNSMDRFARVAREIADQKAREANVARKEALEALNYLEVFLENQMNID